MKGKISRQTKMILLNACYNEKEIQSILDFVPEMTDKECVEMQTIQIAIHRWANEAFGNPKYKMQRMPELCKSIVDEAQELAEKPYDIYSFADLFITMLDSLSAADYRFADLMYAIKIKLVINKNRKWYRDIDDKIQHKEKDNES